MQTRKMTDSNTEQTKVVIVLHFTAILFFHSFFFILTSDDSDDPVDHPEPCYYPSNHSNMARWLRIDSHPSSFSFFCLRVFHSIPAFSPEIILFRKDILNLNHGNPRKGTSLAPEILFSCRVLKLCLPSLLLVFGSLPPSFSPPLNPR